MQRVRGRINHDEICFPKLQKQMSKLWTNLAVKLLQSKYDYFMHYFRHKNGFASVNLHHQDESVLILSSKHKYIHLKTHWASHTMHQNLAIFLWHFNYGKNSFIVLIHNVVSFPGFRLASSFFRPRTSAPSRPSRVGSERLRTNAATFPWSSYRTKLISCTKPKSTGTNLLHGTGGRHR